MNLVTPDGGLLFWMTLIFLLLFFVLAKFGFPVITRAVEKRSRNIDEALRQARQAQERMEALQAEQQALLDKTREEQARILRETARTRDHIISQARTAAQEESARILAKAKTEIAAEKASALREVRREVAMISVDVAEKVLRENLSTSDSQTHYINSLIEEFLSKRTN